MRYINYWLDSVIADSSVGSRGELVDPEMVAYSLRCYDECLVAFINGETL
jgi:hypothetical protein